MKIRQYGSSTGKCVSSDKIENSYCGLLSYETVAKKVVPIFQTLPITSGYPVRTNCLVHKFISTYTTFTLYACNGTFIMVLAGVYKFRVPGSSGD